MALKIFTHDPSGLLASIKKAIDDKKVKTWSYNAKNEFDHTADNWTGLCKFTVTVHNGYLHCTAAYPTGHTKWANDSVYGVYQGRFGEMLMNHFVNKFEFIATGDFKKIGNLSYSATEKPKSTL